MANDQLLFLKLADAYARPSGAYRGASAALDVANQGLEGYMKGTQAGEDIRKQRMGKKLLGDVLGKGIDGISINEAEAISKPVEAYAALLKAKREAQLKDARAQQANFLINGKLSEYDPDKGYTPARMSGFDESGTPTATPSSPTFTPRVPPALPAEQINKNAELKNMLTDISLVRETKQPSMVGPVNSLITSGKQLTGIGATPDAAIFKSTVSGLRNKVLNLLSGAAISPAEAKRLMSQLPSEGRSNVDFDAVLNNFERETRNILANRETGFKQAGFRGVNGTTQVKTFANEQEAEASGYKGPAIINGKRAVIH